VPKKIKVIADTNALMMPFQFRVNIEKELERLLASYEILVPSSVLAELRRLASSNEKARSAIKLAERYKVVETEEVGDESILEIASKHGACVLTNDKILLSKLKDAGIPRIFLRSRSHLVLKPSKQSF